MARRSAVPAVLLLAALGGLAWLNVQASRIRIDITPRPPVAAPRASLPVVEPAAPARPLAPLSAYRETLERPLFSPTRRPPAPPLPPQTVEAPPPPPPPKPTAAPIDSIRVAGVLILPAGGRALIRIGGEPKPSWMRVGDVAGGWTLVDIRAQGVLLEADGTRHELRVTQAAGGPAAGDEPAPRQ
jgi:general secretion pathway protein N